MAHYEQLEPDKTKLTTLSTRKNARKVARTAYTDKLDSNSFTMEPTLLQELSLFG